MAVTVTLMGTGTSLGVPAIGCTCATCQSDDPKNTRLRTSVLVKNDDTTLVIDVPQDFRQQALHHNIHQLHAVLLTHHHADHIMGLDDLRVYNNLMGRMLDIHLSPMSAQWLQRVFPYIFSPDPEYQSFLPQLRLVEIDGPFRLGTLDIQPVPVFHNTLPVLGFRLGGFAFLTDCNRVPDESRKLLQGLDVLVLDALRHRPHPAHFTLDEAVAEARRIGARRTYFTHIACDLEHHSTNATLPENMELAYDGLTLTFE